MLLPVIDFANHPAYAPLASQVTDAERAAAIEEYKGFADNARRNLARYRPFWNSPGRGANPNNSPIYEPMVKDGYAPLHLPLGLKAQALELGMPHFEAMRARIQGDPDRAMTHAAVKLDLNDIIGSQYATLLGGILNEFGIMPAVSSYLGMPNIAVKQLQFKIASAHWTEASGAPGAFPDIEGEDGTAAEQLHVDAPACDIKLIVYLSEVLDRSHGPFSYVPGTQANPYLSLDEFALRVATNSFVIDRSIAGRHRLMQLPEMYRQRIDFGADLEPGGRVVTELLARERVFYSNQVDGILFDTKGVHRGALIRSGERLIMQATLQGMAD